MVEKVPEPAVINWSSPAMQNLLWQFIGPFLIQLFHSSEMCYEVQEEALECYTNDIYRLYTIVSSIKNLKQESTLETYQRILDKSVILCKNLKLSCFLQKPLKIILHNVRSSSWLLLYRGSNRNLNQVVIRSWLAPLVQPWKTLSGGYLIRYEINVLLFHQVLIQCHQLLCLKTLQTSGRNGSNNNHPGVLIARRLDILRKDVGRKTVVLFQLHPLLAPGMLFRLPNTLLLPQLNTPMVQQLVLLMVWSNNLCYSWLLYWTLDGRF